MSLVVPHNECRKEGVFYTPLWFYLIEFSPLREKMAAFEDLI